MKHENHITLRGYQEAAVAAALDSLASGRKPVISLPTGSGKSLVAAAICAARPGRTLVLSHRKELLEQDCAALARYDPTISSGIYSAGLNRRDTDERVIFAGVASAYKKIDELQRAGPFSTVLIDESHLVPQQGSDAVMYTSCLSALQHAGLCGLTATPYRSDSGLLHEGDGAWFDDLAIHIPPSELVSAGFLSPLVGVGGREQIDTDGVRVRQGEFISSELSQIACRNDRVALTVEEMLRRATGRKSVITFAIDVEHAKMVAREIHSRKESVAIITGKTPADEREWHIAQFRDGYIRHIVNVGVLTTGFDAPATDCVAILRPTLSKGLYVQMAGRGMRLAEGKENCLILDFGGNIIRHGSMDMLQAIRHERTEKQEREEREARNASREAREKQYQHAVRAFGGDPMTGRPSGLVELPVLKMQYWITDAKKLSGKRNVVVDYCCDGLTVRQWLCVEYTGGARWYAAQWYRRRGMEAPRDAGSALKMARQASPPESISFFYEEQNGKRWPRVAIEHFADSEDDNREETA